MANIKSEISNIGKRIVRLSNCFSSDKEFLKKCGITNESFVTDLRKGRVQSPGAEMLAKIVRGTGCSGRWLLTGEGEMFPPQQPNGKAATEEKHLSDIIQALRLIGELEDYDKEVLKAAGLPENMPSKLLKLASELLEK